MPLPDLNENQIQFAEMLREADHIRPVRPIYEGAEGRRNEFLDVYTAGDLVILHDPNAEWFNELITTGFDLNWAMDSFYDAFFDHFEDEYEYLTVLLVQDFGIFAAFYQPMANDVVGLGYDNSVGRDIFDNTLQSKIEGMLFMNYYGIWTEDRAVSRYVFGQEFTHRWGSFTQVQLDGQDPDVLLGRDTAHWSYWFDTPNSPMEGNDWVDQLDGTWSIDTSVSTHSMLDMYLMGLAAPEEVGTQTLLLVDQAAQDDVNRDPTYTPEFLGDLQGDRTTVINVPATPVTFELSAITAMEGERDPAFGDAPTTFHMPILVLVLAGDELTDERIAEIDALRLSWEADWEEDVLGRGDLITELGTNDAPVWGEAEDTGGEDSGDTAEVDSGDSDDEVEEEEEEADDDTKDETPAGCGCDAAGAVPGALGAASVAIATVRRRRIL